MQVDAPAVDWASDNPLTPVNLIQPQTPILTSTLFVLSSHFNVTTNLLRDGLFLLINTRSSPWGK